VLEDRAAVRYAEGSHNVPWTSSAYVCQFRELFRSGGRGSQESIAQNTLMRAAAIRSKLLGCLHLHRQEQYDWRVQETNYNNSLPQNRTTVTLGGPDSRHPPLRVHFVHKPCAKPNAVPLLFCHGWPGSFAEVSKIIDPLVDPKSARGQNADIQGFHVVAPSIPGFGFSDASPNEGFGLRATAHVYDMLMKRLGYNEYVAHGTGW